MGFSRPAAASGMAATLYAKAQNRLPLITASVRRADTMKKLWSMPVNANATAIIGDNGGSPEVEGTEEWQAEKFRRHWAQVVVRDRVCGYTFWVYKDYKQRRGYNQDYNGISVMGLMDFTEEHPRLVHQAYAEALSPPR